MIDLARLRKALDEWDHGEVRIAAEWLIDLADEGSELWAEKPCEHGEIESHWLSHTCYSTHSLDACPHCPGGSRVRVWPEKDR